MDLPAQLRDNLRDRCRVPREAPILVAVSGGVDSIVLLHLLWAGRGEPPGHLLVAHYNHALRGRESDRDQALVRRLASDLGLPFLAGRAVAADWRRFPGRSMEMAARELRHRFLADTAVQSGFPLIALAHHADDQVELFFLRLLRGAGVAGLAGMKWRGGAPSQDDDREAPVQPGLVPPRAEARPEIIRPLLSVPKAELIEYAKAHKLSFREDATNSSLAIPRNRIRQELIPLLERSYQRNLREVTTRAMELLRAEAEFTEQAAVRWLQPARARPGGRPEERLPADEGRFDALPVAVQRSCILLQLRQSGLREEFELVEKLRHRVNTNFSAALLDGPGSGGDLLAWVSRDDEGRLHEEHPPACGFCAASREIDLGSRGEAGLGGTSIRWSIRSVKGMKLPPARSGVEWFDADRLGEGAKLRHWQPGDRFRPIGMKSSVKLQDLFVNQRIPAARRRRLVVAAAESGELFWVEGLRIGELFKVTAGTRRRLRWEWGRLADQPVAPPGENP